MSSDKSNSTPLNKYKQTGKKLTPPLATLNMQTASWINDRLPEMLWATLIRERHQGDMGYAIFRDIMMWLGNNLGKSKIVGVTHTDIANFPIKLRKSFIKHIVEQAGTDALRPLLLLPNLPAFEEWQQALAINPVEEEDWSHLADAVSITLFHQSQEATDVRWVKLGGTILSGKIKFTSAIIETIDNINHYPNRGDQRSVRPSIRSMEIMDNLKWKEYKWAKIFWEYCYENTVCIPEINKKSQEEILRKQHAVSKDKKHYYAKTPKIRDNLISHFFNTTRTSAIDSRHETVFGLAIYALDIFIENIILLTSSTPNGRVTARIILESYLTLAYLMKKETENELLWDAYRDYGSGQISLIERKYEDNNLSSDMVDIKKMDIIANEDKWSEFVPINLGHWDTTDLRKISLEVGEKELYDKYYSYTSGYVHANWGAVREAAFQSCFNPLHRLHRVPSFGLPILSNVNEDCRIIINKILGLVDKAYPKFKHTVPKPSKGPVKLKGKDKKK